MIDISMGKDEKQYYITNVKMKDDGENFIVFYADGHTEEQEFTAHNYNVYIYRMKHQVLDNRWSYVATQNFVISMAILKAAKALIIVCNSCSCKVKFAFICSIFDSNI